MLIGQARVSTGDQNLDLQRDALQRAGCGRISEEKKSRPAGTRRTALEAGLADLRSEDPLVVWTVGRLGRALREMLDTTHTLQTQMVMLRSLTKAVDAETPTGRRAESFRTDLMPVDDGALEIVRAWVEEPKCDHPRGPSDPMFPATEMGVGEEGGSRPMGLARRGGATSEPVRDTVRKAFALAGLPDHDPRSVRSVLVRHAMTLDLMPEAMKQWSQSLGHADVPTTFTSSGEVPARRQREIVRRMTPSVLGAADGANDAVAPVEAALALAEAKRPRAAPHAQRPSRETARTGGASAPDGD